MLQGLRMGLIMHQFLQPVVAEMLMHCFDTFLNGLSEEIKDELVSHDLPRNSEGLGNIAIRTDMRLQERCRTRASGGSPGTFFFNSAIQPPSPSTDAPGPEPMPVDHTT